MNLKKSVKAAANGFTLLEVLIAITLTGLVMGSIFALQSQNKQLTFRSLNALERIAQQREAINLAWLGASDSHYQSIARKEYKYHSDNITTLAIPESLEKEQSKINNYKFKLQSVDIVNALDETFFTTIQWAKKE